jgi:hypothetical protein
VNRRLLERIDWRLKQLEGRTSSDAASPPSTATKQNRAA